MSKYSAEKFIAAIPGTGGIVTAIAKRVGCAWHTADAYIQAHATVKTAWDNERRRINDQAQHNILKAIADGDLATSKWWLQVMDDEFKSTSDLMVKFTWDDADG